FAPGTNIVSAYYTSSTATATLSGTSMASPHVAGVAALYLQNNTTATPSTVNSAIINAAFVNKLTGIGSGSPNRLLNALLIAPLSLSLTCQPYSAGLGYCEAVASGGSGTGYSFTWANAYEMNDSNGWSNATAECYYDGYYVFPVDVFATVTDSNGTSVTEYREIYCPPGWPSP
ncbi:MAG TPA: S8 family serine peptidase, partial [Longimicrobium sp.]|uniref:S8 family serine peptidase n=1 Tax=Longimicrobium sp. TaxID=2029185 RepID=UPI002EDBB27D